MYTIRGPVSVVGIATSYGLRIPVGARFSAPVQTGPGTHPASYTMGTGSFSGVKRDQGVTLTPHPLLVPWSKKSRAIYIYCPYGPYSLYRASVPVQYSYTSTAPMGRTACTEPQCLYSTAIPLLPLWVIRPVQSHSACTVELYLYSLYRPYGLYRASVPVQYS
jgi:hypothetical protein